MHLPLSFAAVNDSRPTSLGVMPHTVSPRKGVRGTSRQRCETFGMPVAEGCRDIGRADITGGDFESSDVNCEEWRRYDANISMYCVIGIALISQVDLVFRYLSSRFPDQLSVLSCYRFRCLLVAEVWVFQINHLVGSRLQASLLDYRSAGRQRFNGDGDGGGGQHAGHGLR
ncbi:hypothetical protein C8J56DRAFT_890562 [Mycena floridula]|nr:hypothetical protein C8J56DRAFT_890562 [Mycena floridula]